MQTTTARPLSRLPDRVLLARTRHLVDRERHLHVEIVDHLREIEDRDLHLARGFSTLFDYAVNELGYSNGAAWRRTLAMRLCRRMADVRARLRNGSLTLSTAAQLQSAFERQERKRRRTWAQQQKRRSEQAAASTTAPVAARDGQSTDRLPVGTAASPPHAAGSVRVQVPVVVLDATGQRELVKQATGKSSRQVEELLASVDPSLTSPREQLRARGDGTWTFTVVVDRECRQGLDHLKALLSHVDPAMSYGQLVTGSCRMNCDVATPACTARPEPIPGRRLMVRRRSGRRSLSPTARRPGTEPRRSRPKLFRRRSALPRTAVRLLRSRTKREPAMTAAGSRRRPGGASPPRSSGLSGSGIRDAVHTSIRRPDAAAALGTCFRSITSGRGRGEAGPSSTISDCSVMPIIGIAMQGRRFRDRGRIDPHPASYSIVVCQLEGDEHGR